MNEQSHDDKVAELLAHINPPPGTDLAAVLGRLDKVSEELKQITADVAVHGVAVGRDAMGLIGDYATAWDWLAVGVRRVAEQGGLIDAGQLLDVMQELHDCFGLKTRPPNGHKQDERAELT